MDRQAEPPALETFLVERYWPGIDLRRLHAVLPRLELEAQAMRSEGIRVEHVASILMPVDEVVFSLIAAASEADVRLVNERAELPVDRIAGAIAILTTSRSTPLDTQAPGRDAAAATGARAAARPRRRWRTSR